ncbi:hypothetical protein KC614_00320 [candidate division WWE3 bacterium]|uniref:NlpC/P60 domain-containing protein n=1 Tax=candidate division WWE3 bacterium TaxID=2053526 RepID=A0A955RRK7_UNCKA|nr:hypothetical protein [candidate division WWE3 bacterium]
MITDFAEAVSARVNEYLNLRIGRHTIAAPYFANYIGMMFVQLMRDHGVAEESIQKMSAAYKNKEVPFGWYRGKGTPEEIINTTKELADFYGLDLAAVTSEGLVEFMKFYGIGIDCSGFVYELLRYGAESLDMVDQLNDSLSWIDPEKVGRDYAGTFVFAGEGSQVISPNDVAALDLVITKDKNAKYDHVGMFIKEGEELYLVQSTLALLPTGVSKSKVKTLSQDKIDLGYESNFGSDHTKMYREGVLEFRRLKFIDAL